MKKICVCGLNPSWQKTLTFNMFQKGKINRAAALEATASGKGINFARAVKTWDAAEATVYQFLAGDAGKAVRRALWEEKISNVSAEIPGETRTCTTVLSESDQVMTELIEPAPEVTPDAAASLFQALQAGIAGADALAVCGTYPPGINEFFYAKTAREAALKQKAVMLDSFKGVDAVLESGVDLLKINRDELAALSGEAETANAFRVCFERFKIRMLAVTDGPGKAYYADAPGEILVLSIPPLENVVNPIGSGDTCSAVMFSEWLNGTPGPEAFRRGLAAASANCLTRGPAEFTRESAESLLNAVHIDKLNE